MPVKAPHQLLVGACRFTALAHAERVKPITHPITRLPGRDANEVTA